MDGVAGGGALHALIVLLFLLQFSLFLERMLGLLLGFLFALVFASLVTHVYPSLLDIDMRRAAAPNPLLMEKE
jgi:hypothetical protein